MDAIDQKIAVWKNKYGEVHQVEVEVGEPRERAVAYFRKPDLEVIGAASRFSESDPLKSGNILFESCWLDGDERIKLEPEARVGVMRVLATLFKTREATIKKL